MRLAHLSPSLTVARPPRPAEPQDIQSRMGRRLRQLRAERHWTQMRMAGDLGLDRSFLSDVERGRKAMSLRTMETLALGLKISISELVRDL